MRQIFFVFAILCGAAHADGVPLLSAPPALSASQNTRLAELQMKRHVLGVFTPEPNALAGNVLTLTINGKSYRFAGGPTHDDVPGGQSWAGKTAEGYSAVITHSKGIMNGTIYVDSGRYILTPIGKQVALIASQGSGIVERARPAAPPASGVHP